MERKMLMTLIIQNATVVFKDRVVPETAVLIADGIIKQIVTAKESARNWPGAKVIDAQNRLVMPGMIDIHSDAIEKEIEPRPGIHFPVELALAQLERRLAAQGFTNVYHSLSLAGGAGVRDDRMAQEIIRKIKTREQAVIRNQVHLRYEITNFESWDTVTQLLDLGWVDLFSLMDHSPGQGQYRTAEDYRDYVRKTYHCSEEEINRMVAQGVQRRVLIQTDRLEKLINHALLRKITVALHDADHIGQIQWGQKIGISIAEFPINMETAASAISAGMLVLVGSPNIARGGSHNSNLSALELIKAGYANAICSDYYSGSTLNAVFKVAAVLDDLAAAVNMVSYHPAKALGIAAQTGTIEPGKQADLIIVGMSGAMPVVYQTLVNGKPVYSGDFWQPRVSRAKVNDYRLVADI
jgi:alpha-D-ribose 1-methylphosphonate 5-triphosphate diphosphatase